MTFPAVPLNFPNIIEGLSSLVPPAGGATIVDTVRYYSSLAQGTTTDALKFVNIPPCNKNKLW